MRKLTYLILSLILSTSAFALSMKKGPMLIGSSQQKPDPSAVLEVFSTAKGLLPPRLTTLQRDAIAVPATGLEIYNVDSNSPQYFNGVTWVSSGGTGTSFQLTIVAHGRPLGCPLSPVYFDGTDWLDARADAQATLATHVITRVIDVDTLEISQSGRFSCNSHGLTSGLHYFTGVTGGLANFPAPTYNNPIILVENTDMVHIMPYRATGPALQTVGQVDTVFGRTGNVISTLGDYSADLVSFTPTASLLSTETQAAIEEVDAKVLAIDFSGKVDSTIEIQSGEGLQGGGDLTSNRSLSLDYNGLTSQGTNVLDVYSFFDGTDHRKTTLADMLSAIALPLNDLIDVNGAATSGQVLTYNGTDYDFTDKTVNTDSQDASQVPFTPFSFYVSTDTQAAIQEIENTLTTNINAKAEESIQILAGSGLVGGGDLTSDRTLTVDPSAIDITTLQNFNANSFIDMSTVSIDVSDTEDGLHITNTNSDGSLEEDVQLAIDIPSLSLENPAKVSSQLLAFSTVTNKLVKVNVQSVADTAAAAVAFPVDEVNGQVGIVSLDTDDIPITATNVYVTPAEKSQITTNATNVASNTGNIATNTTNIGNNTSAISFNGGGIATNANNNTNTQNDLDIAEATIATLGTVAFDDDYNSLINLPTLGTAASTAATDYATAAQGVLADSAIQAGANLSIFNNDAGFITGAAIPVDSVNSKTGTVVIDPDDLDDTATTNKFATAAQLALIATNESEIDLNDADISTNASNISTNTSNIVSNDTDIGTNATNTANHISDLANPHAVTATQVGLGNVDNTSDANKSLSAASIAALALKADISSLSTVATSNDYNDLDNLPTLGTAAATAITDYATAAQGLLADSALQSGDNNSELVNDSNYVTALTAPVTTVNTQTGDVVLVANDIGYTPIGTSNYSPAVALVKTALDQLEQRNTDVVANVAVNAGLITTNSTNTGTNATNIVTNTGNIATNDTELADHESRISQNELDIAGLGVGALELRITQNEGDISSLQTNVTAAETAITALQTDKYDASNPLGFETPAELDARDTANRSRANHTGTQLAATISDFDTAVTIYNDRFFDQDFTQQVETSNAFQNRFNVTYNLAHSTTYKVTVNYNWAYNLATNDFNARLQVNGATVKSHVQEPKDVGGANGAAGTNQRHQATMVYIFTAVAGNNTFALQFGSTDNVTLATINSHTLTVERF
jgi:hypothetical protein